MLHSFCHGPVTSQNHGYRLRYKLSLPNKAVSGSILIQFMLTTLDFKATRHNGQLNYSSTNKILQKLTIPAFISNLKP